MNSLIPLCREYGGWAIFFTVAFIIASAPIILDLPTPKEAITFNSLSFKPVNPESNDASAEERLLPDSWRHNSSSNLTHGRYRGTFNLDESPQTLWGVFIPAHRSNLSVKVNNIYIGDGGSFQPVLARNGMYPMLFSIPQGLLHNGENIIEIDLFAAPAGHGFLDTVYVGSHEALKPSYQLHYHSLQTITQIIAFSMFILGIVMLVIWLNKSQDITYGLLAGMAISWAVQNLNMVVNEIPVSLMTWERIMHVSAIWLSSFSYLFINAYFNSWAVKKINFFAQFNIIYSLALSLALIILPPSLFYEVFYIAAMPYQVMLLIYIFVQMCRMSLMTKRTADKLLMSVAIICMTFTTHDALVTTGIIQSHVFYLSGFCGLFTFLFFGWTLVSRFMDATKLLENSNAILSQRLEERENELKLVFEKQKQYEQRAAMEQERERLMRDIHDGLGGQLVSILSIAEHKEVNNDQIVSAVRFALDDLRLIVNSLDDSNMNLPSLLGLFRERILSRYEQVGMTVKWDVDQVSQNDNFYPKRALQILRILQEAAANTGKHANATEIRVSLKENLNAHKASIIIEYADNGIGFEMHGEPTGYGLGNMIARAKKAGISLSIDSAKNAGTKITLVL